MNNFQAGMLCPVKIKPAVLSANPLFTMNITGYSGTDIETFLHDCSHTGLNGNTGRIAGKRDISGTINADFDMDIPPYGDPPHIIDGSSGLIYFMVSGPIGPEQQALGVTYQGPPRGIQVPYIVGKVHYEAAVGTQVKYSFDIKMNAFAGSFAYNVAA